MTAVRSTPARRGAWRALLAVLTLTGAALLLPSNAARAASATKACSILSAADFKAAGVKTVMGTPAENTGAALAPGGSACDWTVTTADGNQMVVELAYGRNLRQRTIMQFFATRVVPIAGLAAGSVYVEADESSTQSAYNGVVVKRGTLVITLQATLDTVPKASMLALAKTLNRKKV